MLSKKKFLLKILFFSAIWSWACLIWIHFMYNSNYQWNAMPHINQAYCRWPPKSLREIWTQNDTYNITLCIESNESTLRNPAPMNYRLSDLFRMKETNFQITFEEMWRLNRQIWRYAQYPTIYKTYPQDVQMDEIIRSIKSGSPVSVVSCFILYRLIS